MKALVATVMLVAVAGLAGCRGAAHVPPTNYEIPQRFTGWVTVEFEIAEAPALPDDHGARLIRVPSGGVMRTSNRQVLGILDNHFYFLDAAGARVPIDEPAARPDAAPDEAAKPHDRPVVLGFETGDIRDASGHRVFERFYVGPGPAGTPPAP